MKGKMKTEQLISLEVSTLLEQFKETSSMVKAMVNRTTSEIPQDLKAVTEIKTSKAAVITALTKEILAQAINKVKVHSLKRIKLMIMANNDQLFKA